MVHGKKPTARQRRAIAKALNTPYEFECLIIKTNITKDNVTYTIRNRDNNQEQVVRCPKR